MMNRKNMAMTAIILVVVFGITVIAYPLIFNPNTTTATDASPANMPVVPAGQ